MAPACWRKKANRGKTPTDVWWHTIVSPNGKEKQSYATRSRWEFCPESSISIQGPATKLCDFFRRQRQLSEAAYKLNRDCILMRQESPGNGNHEKRFASFSAECWKFNCDFADIEKQRT